MSGKSKLIETIKANVSKHRSIQNTTDFQGMEGYTAMEAPSDI